MLFAGVVPVDKAKLCPYAGFFSTVMTESYAKSPAPICTVVSLFCVERTVAVVDVMYSCVLSALHSLVGSEGHMSILSTILSLSESRHPRFSSIWPSQLSSFELHTSVAAGFTLGS